ncbi:hypothetical protein ACFO3U_08840 [Flavobacterium ponti]|uniref:Uncharacterized protein n=1 Tax=Flavobacterium ponti TaxID=665133 RepID=A0ABV9P6R5_9FLAO
MQDNELRNEIEKKEVLFQKLFTKYQYNIRKVPNYINFDAFKDLKLIFELYSEIFHLRGFNYNKLSNIKLEKIINPYSASEKKELISHLVKALVKNGNEEEAKSVMELLNKIEIKYYWENIKLKNNLLINSVKLLLKIISYNILVLLLFLTLYLFISTLFFCESKFECLAILDVKKVNITEINWLNNFGNLLTYIFDLDSKMEVIPLNFYGVLLLVFQKSFLILILGNYIVKEIFNKIKLK